MDMRTGMAYAKPEPKARTKGRKLRLKSKGTHETHDYVFMRERHVCRADRFRGAQSMHELRFRSQGGKVSRRNSVAVCGDGVNGCHGYLQRHEIGYVFEDDTLGAEGPIRFTPRTQRAADWLKVKVGESIVSAPMRDYEVAV